MSKNVRDTGELSEIAKLIDRRIEELAHEKSQKDIARDLGYDKPNIITMFKKGDAKVPLDKAYLLARSLQVDPALVLRLVLEQTTFTDGARESIRKIIGNIVTDNELEIINFIRGCSDRKDPKLDDGQKEALRAIFTKAG